METRFRRDLLAWLADDAVLAAGLNAIAEESPAPVSPPWLGIAASAGSPDAERVHAAVGAGSGRWAGAALYAERAGSLLPIATAAPPRAITGVLEHPLGASPALIFEPAAWLQIQCDDPEAEFETIDLAAIAAGGNRLLVGGEIVQFLEAAPLGAERWRLTGLLRGRGATESEARAGHAAGTRACLLDHRLRLLDGSAFDAATERLAAIGAGDAEPVFSVVRAAGRSRQPLSPVHPVTEPAPGGGLMLAWTRRARGAWVWRDGVDVPLVEEAELYEVGAGPEHSPLALWQASAPAVGLTAADLAPLPAGTQLWVRQVGRHALSRPLTLHVLS